MELENNNVICCFFGGVVAISISMGNAEEQKTYTLTEVKTACGEYTLSNVGNFLTNEVEKTKEYQKRVGKK